MEFASHMLGNSSLWTHAKLTTKSKNGRLVYFNMKQIALGDQYLSHRVKYIEDKLGKLAYKGETLSWTWTLSKDSEKFVNLFAPTEELVPLGFHGYDPKTHVDEFLAGIQLDAFSPVKVVIHENNCTDLAEAIRKMKNHLQDNPGLQVIKRGIGVSAVESPPNVVDVMTTSVVLVLGPLPILPSMRGLMPKLGLPLWPRGSVDRRVVSCPPISTSICLSRRRRSSGRFILNARRRARMLPPPTVGTTILNLSQDRDSLADLQKDVRELLGPAVESAS